MRSGGISLPIRVEATRVDMRTAPLKAVEVATPLQPLWKANGKVGASAASQRIAERPLSRSGRARVPTTGIRRAAREIPTAREGALCPPSSGLSIIRRAHFSQSSGGQGKPSRIWRPCRELGRTAEGCLAPSGSPLEAVPPAPIQ